jgi:ribosomal protein L40E
MQNDATKTNDRPLGDEPVQRAIRCETCGGLNPPTASWCGQCLTRFDRPEAPSPLAATEESPPAATKGSPPVAAAKSVSPQEPSLETPEGVAFRVTEEGITWTCSVCDTINDLDRSLCEVCGAPFAKTVLPEEEDPPRDPNLVALLSLLLPGAGHAYIGNWGQAIARGVISLWVILVVFVAALQRGAASSNLVMVVFGVVAFGLWGVGAHDAYREARKERALVILKGKIFFYLVLGLLLLLIALLMSAAMRANGS